MSIKDEAAALRRAIQEYDDGHPAADAAGTISPEVNSELAAVDPVIKAAQALLTSVTEMIELDVWLDIVEGMDIGPLDHLTCTEAEALADLMTAMRGPERGQMVIIHHFWDSDEEVGELADHLAKWPDLRADLREAFSEDADIIQTLDELEAEEG